MRKILAVFSLLLAFPIAVHAAEVDRQIPSSNQEIRLSFAPIVKQASPAVVNIVTKRRVQQAVSPLMADPFFRQFMGGDLMPGMTREREQSSLGSGVVVKPDGVIVTSNHVVKGAEEITVILSDRREFAAKVVLRDERTDLAVLRIDTGKEKLPIIALGNSDSLQVGDLVLAIGNPFGVGQTVTSGIVSGLARTNVGIADYSFFIQTDASINPGNSGGALLTMDGKLAGINTAIFSQNGQSAGIGFAIPSNMVETVIESSIAGRKLERPWMGISSQAVTMDLAQNLGLSRPAGVLVNSVHKAAPRGQLLFDGNVVDENESFSRGDIITAINDIAVDDPQSLKFRVATMRVGETADFALLRNGKKYEMRLKLIAAPGGEAGWQRTIEGNNPLSGAVVAQITPALEDELGITESEGVVIVDWKNPRGNRLNFRPGDILLQVNGLKIGDIGDVEKAFAKPARRWDIVIQRGVQVIRGILQG